MDFDSSGRRLNPDPPPPGGAPRSVARRTAALIVAVFLCRALAGAVIVPPWQGPDEPSHFVLAMLLASPGGDTPATRAPLERDVLRSMAAHGWWTYYQKPTPEPLPVAFADVPEHLATGTLLQPAFYYLAAAVLRASPSEDVVANYHLLRALSILLSVAALVFGWAGTAQLLGVAAATGATALVALHPQFLLSALTIGPDSLINLCGALMWWQAARLQQARGWRWLAAAAAVCVAAIVAALSKRNGIPLLAIAMLVAAAGLAGRVPGARRRAVWVAAAGVVYGVAAIVSQLWDRVPLLTFWSYALVPERSLADVTLDTVLPFLSSAMRSSWLVAGWSRFPAPGWWNIATGAITIAGLLGAAVLGVRARRGSRALWLPWLFVGVNVASLLVVAFFGGAAPQGRYFMAVVAPAAALLWIGLTYWSPQRFRGAAQATVIALVALLDLAGFAFVLMPQYR